MSGLLLAAAFPKIGVAGLAWVAPAGLLFSALGTCGMRAFRIGYVGGLAYYLASLYWLLLIPFPSGAIAGWLALGAYLSLYPATWVWLCWSVCPRGAPACLDSVPPRGLSASSAPGMVSEQLPAPDSAPPAATSVPVGSLAAAVRAYVALPLAARVLWALECAAIWIGLEMVVARLFTGFAWNVLGASQYQILPVIQIAEFTGVYGVSFLLVWFSVSLVGAALKLAAQPTRSKAWVGDLILPLIALIVVIAYGSTQLAQVHAPSRTLRAVLIQPSIPQTLIWDTNQNAVRFTQLVQLSERALEKTTNADLLVWPEAAVPNMLRFDYDTYSAVTNLALQHHVWIILGSDDAALRPGGTERDVQYFNSSFLVTPDGHVAAAYRKRQLVIFGEYIPLEHWMPFMKYLTPVGGSFTAGKEPLPFPMESLHAKTSVLICFEDVFPHLVREYVEPDTDFLLNLTNNGWFGESAAQWQHAANAVLRTVENRIPLVRCANNGLTCWVDSFGGMHNVYFPNTTDIYGVGFKVVDVPLLPLGTQRQLTFYTRHGDWFGWSCFGATLLLGIGRLARFARARRDATQLTVP